MTPNEDAYGNALARIHSRATALCPLPICFSAYGHESEDDEAPPVDNLDVRVLEGKCKFVQQYDEFWAGMSIQAHFGNVDLPLAERPGGFESDVIENPTWLQLCYIFALQVQRTHDTHHVFLEGVEVLGEENGVKICEFVAGS